MGRMPQFVDLGALIRRNAGAIGIVDLVEQEPLAHRDPKNAIQHVAGYLQRERFTCGVAKAEERTRIASIDDLISSQ